MNCDGYLMVLAVEWIGFINRALTAYPNTFTSQTPDILNVLFILIAPVWFAASIYIVFGRIIILVDGHHLSFIRQKWLTVIFVCSDIFCFLIQAGGKNNPTSLRQ
jgi:RTA1 like protein